MKKTTIKIIITTVFAFIAIPLFSTSSNPQVRAVDVAQANPAGGGECQNCHEIPGPPAPPENFNPLEGPTNEDFDALNPLKSQKSPYAKNLSTPGSIISRILDFALPIGGMLLFVLLVWGGFEILTGAASSKSIDSGKQRIKAALIGFIILFSSYWMAQIVQEIFGIIIL